MAALLLLASAAAAQTNAGSSQQDFNGRSLSMALTNPPLPVASASVSRTGNPGNVLYYYWLVTQTLAGASSPAGPFIAPQSASTLSGSQFNTIGWAAVQGALSYDVLRTITPAQPTGACACAVATGVTLTTQNDQSNSLGAYSVLALDPLSLMLTLTNEATGASASQLTLRRAGTAVPVVGATYRKKTCQLAFGTDDGSPLATANIQPQRTLCKVEDASTVTTVIWMVDAGASTVQVGFRDNAATTAISPLLTPATVAGITDKVACANAAGTVITIEGNSVTCSTLSNTALAAGDTLQTIAGTADGTSKRGIAFITYTVN